MSEINAILQDGDNVPMPALRGYLASLEAALAQANLTIATGTAAALVGDRTYATQAALFADLVPADNLFALVYADADPLKNGLYQKDGATTAGDWDGPFDLFSSAAEALVQPLVDAVEAARLEVVAIADDVVLLNPVVNFARPLVLEYDATGKQVLLASAFAARFGETETLRSPDDGDIDNPDPLYDVIDITTGTAPGVAYRVSISKDALDLSELPYVINSGDVFGVAAVAQVLNGSVDTQHRLAVPSPNQYRFGLDPTGAPRVFGTTAPVALTNTDITALGFTTGMQAADGNSFYGDNAPGVLGGDPWFFFRIYAVSETDDAVPNVLANITYTGGDAAGFYQVPMTLERRISPTVTVWIASARLPSGATPARLVNYTVGGGFAVGADDFTYAGLQAAFSTTAPVEWIRWADYRADVGFKVDHIFPTHLFLTEGRETIIRPRMTCSSRLDGPLVYAFDGLPSDNYELLNTFDAFSLSEGQELRVNPAGVGPTASVIMRDPVTQAKYAAPMIVRKGPAALAGTAKILMIGDSLTQYSQVPSFLRDDLVERGLAVTMVGTLNASGGAGNVPTTPALCEGRGGRKYADYINATTDFMTPVDVTGEATYLALSDGAKQAKNPFLREATGGDAASGANQIAYNGYVFDMAFYLERFDLDEPTHVIIMLGTNDILQSPDNDPQAADWISDGMRVIYNQTRAALPTARIAFAVPAIGQPSNSDWRRHHALSVRQHRAFVAAQDDDNLFMIGLYQHQSDLAGWDYTNGAAVDGLVGISAQDDIHFIGPQRGLISREESAFVGATL